MPAVSFSTMKEKILSGEKKQTIRPYSPHWMKWRSGDRCVGYWKMRTKECEKLFDSVFSEDPIVMKWTDFTDELVQRDGFQSSAHAFSEWFYPHYGGELHKMSFVILRWN